MIITDLNNLYVGYNETENFRILICALDVQEAQEIANEYRFDSNMCGSFEITEFTDINTHFDCDYVVTGGQ